MHFLLIALFFGLLLYTASTSAVALAADAERSWFWWSALLPLVVSHWAAGFFATRKNFPGSRRANLDCAAIAGATTILTIGAAAGTAHYVGLLMPRHIAILVLVASSLAGSFGLALAVKRTAAPKG